MQHNWLLAVTSAFYRCTACFNYRTVCPNYSQWHWPHCANECANECFSFHTVCKDHSVPGLAIFKRTHTQHERLRCAGTLWQPINHLACRHDPPQPAHVYVPDVTTLAGEAAVFRDLDDGHAPRPEHSDIIRSAGAAGLLMRFSRPSLVGVVLHALHLLPRPASPGAAMHTSLELHSTAPAYLPACLSSECL